MQPRSITCTSSESLLTMYARLARSLPQRGPEQPAVTAKARQKTRIALMPMFPPRRTSELRRSEAGFLAHGYGLLSLPHRPFGRRVVARVSSRIQWRDRAGVSPASLHLGSLFSCRATFTPRSD